ncbi:MAG: hypothetical protein N2254_09215 [bacterium]|nr:hypothetical protein [bacterium]
MSFQRSALSILMPLKENRRISGENQISRELRNFENSVWCLTDGWRRFIEGAEPLCVEFFGSKNYKKPESESFIK